MASSEVPTRDTALKNYTYKCMQELKCTGHSRG